MDQEREDYADPDPPGREVRAFDLTTIGGAAIILGSLICLVSLPSFFFFLARGVK